MTKFEKQAFVIEFPLQKYGLTFRFVEENDAEFIIGLRVHPQLSKYISHTDNDLRKQQEWIRGYKQREKEGSEYYLLFQDEEGRSQGVVRLYSFENDTYTSGSWLVSPESDELVAIKSDLFAAYFAFEMLNFNYCKIEVRKNNAKVLKYHKRYFKQIGEDEQTVHLLMDRAGYEKKRDFLLFTINH